MSLLDYLPALLPVHRVVKAAIESRLRVQDLAYIMAIVATLAFAACTTFFGLHITRPRHVLGTNFHVLWCRTALLLALIAALASALSFAAIYAISGARSLSPNSSGIHMHIMAVVQLAISFGVIGLSVIPILDLAEVMKLRSLIAAISFIFWANAGWLLFLIQGLPENSRAAYFGYSLIVALTMAQIFYPHGWHRARGEAGYLRALEKYMHLGSYLLVVAVISSALIVLVDIIATEHWNAGYYSYATLGVFAIAGAGFMFTSTSTEGWRKLHRK